MSELTRRQLFARGAGVASGVVLAGAVDLVPEAARAERGAPARSGAPAGEATTAGDRATVQSYLAFMDAVVARIHPQWSESAYGAYRAPGGTFATVINARMLQVHAGAAAAGPQWRQPRRRTRAAARRNAAWLPAPWRTSGVGVTHEKMFHLPGWTTSLTDPDAVMDKAVDPQVAQALVAARRAGATLGLPEATLQQIHAGGLRGGALLLLSLPRHSPQPAQLELRAVCARRGAHRRH